MSHPVLLDMWGSLLVSVGFVLAYGGHCGYFWVSGSRFRSWCWCCKHFIRVDLVSGEVTFNDQRSCLCLYWSHPSLHPIAHLFSWCYPLRSHRLCLSQCSSECGRGSRKRTVTCTNPQGLCDPVSRPAEVEMCEDHSKCYEWKTGEWSKVGWPNNQKFF